LHFRGAGICLMQPIFLYDSALFLLSDCHDLSALLLSFFLVA
jgi:hypothetical protein